MSVPKQKFREIVLQLLYSYDVASPEFDEVRSMVMETLSVSRKNVREAYERMKQIIEKKEEIDALIESISISYSLERIQRIERNIIRMGVYELLFDEEVPPKIAIKEGVRLAKKFSTPEASSFVNALLDVVYKTKEGKKIDDTEIQKEIEKLEIYQKIAEEAALKMKNEEEEK